MSSSALPQHNASEKAAAAAGPRCRAASRLRFCCAVLLLVLLGRAALPALFAESHAPLAAATCPQPAPWQDSAPLGPAPPPLALAKLLSGAVQINTSVFDGTPPVAEAPARWNATFAPFEAYLRRAFPLLHTSGAVQLEHINTHGLLYTYQGSDAALKPIVFTAHQDVVPVDASSEARWTHAPFSGLIDEKLGLVWGRGSSDDKGEQQRVAQAFWC
jgi:Gly-Xaa carboxypeptidase